MAEHSSHPDFDLDTAVSAELDGELDEYAAELGMTPADLRHALAGPEAAARRSELRAVRSALSPDRGPTLDDLTRRRLLAGARGEAPGGVPRDRGWMLRAGVAAVVTLVVVGAIYAVARDPGGSGGSSAKSSARAGSSAAAAVRGDVGDLGTVDAAEVSRLLRGDRRVPTSPTVAESQAADAPPRRSAAAGGTTPFGASAQAVADCASEYGAQGTIRFRGSGTYGGRAAVVLGVDTDRRTIVFVLAAGNCNEVLYSASR